MARIPAREPDPKSDMLIPTAPFAQAARPMARLLREMPKSNRELFFEDRCDICMDLLFNGGTPPQQKIKAAIELGGILGGINDEERVHNSTYILREMMIDDSEHPALRMACAVSLGSSGYADFVEEMEKEVLAARTSVQSKLLWPSGPLRYAGRMGR